MASEWIAVVGTGIGAGIGGFVTVASMVVKGRQEAASEHRRYEWEERIQEENRRREDVIRQDDREEAELDQHLKSPPLLYTRLLQQADDLLDAMSAHHYLSLPEEEPRNVWRPVEKKLKRFKHLATHVDLVANSYETIAATREIIATVARWISDVAVIKSYDEDVSRHLESTSHKLLVNDLRQLRNACRREIGLSAPEPELEPSEQDGLSSTDQGPEAGAGG